MAGQKKQPPTPKMQMPGSHSYTHSSLDSLDLNPQYAYLISPYGIGDTMLLCGLKTAIEQKYRCQIRFIIKPSHEAVLKSYGITDYELARFSLEELKERRDFASFPNPGRMCVAHPHFSTHGKLALKKFNKLEFRFLDLYRLFFDLDGGQQLEQPTVTPQLSEAFRLKLETIAPLEKIVLFCPEANSTSLLPTAFWIKLRDDLHAQGYSIVCSAVDEDNSIPGTRHLPMSLEESIALGAFCKKVYSLRSGLCDMLNARGADLTVFYDNPKTKYLYDLNILHSRGDINETIINRINYRPRVTIVTPVLNLVSAGRLATFSECLESVESQTYPSVEHLIIDGGSSDGTLNLLKEYEAAGRLKVIVAPGTGIYAAMNLGIEAASGEFIAFLNSDDFYHVPNAISESIEALERSGADFSFASVKIHGRENLIFYPSERCFVTTMPFSHQSMFCSKKALLRERFDTSFKLAADLDLIIRLYLKGYKGVQVHAVVATYRANGASGSNLNQCLAEYVEVYRKNYSRFGVFDDHVLERMALAHSAPDELLKALAAENDNVASILKRTTVKQYAQSYLLLGIPMISVFETKSKKVVRLLGFIRFSKSNRTKDGTTMNILGLIDFERSETMLEIRLLKSLSLFQRVKTNKQTKIKTLGFISLFAQKRKTLAQQTVFR